MQRLALVAVRTRTPADANHVSGGLQEEIADDWTEAYRKRVPSRWKGPNMARAPSYDFERRERQKAKDAKRAEKAQGKREKRENVSGDATQAEPVVTETDDVVAADKVKKG